ncbi:MAG: 4Fe-4S binding protein [Erysipelotrichaceae bacterium]|nr:4Fe-4S binding protein [Erysipelotrichaceae bacterium]
MALRRIIEINEDLCNGCGICVDACHEGAIGLINGKAMLLRDDYCDGLGDCLPTCPTNAITFVEREALAFDKEAVMKNMEAKNQDISLQSGCPGEQSRNMQRVNYENEKVSINSQLTQWPVQIKLAPVIAPYFENANLLIAADCTAFAYGNFHNDFIKKHITLIGCPKLDSVDYSEKLTEIIINNDIKSVKVVRMEVPCCKGIENAVKNALINSGKMIPWQIVTVTIEGGILED